jgi:hypothetical protein
MSKRFALERMSWPTRFLFFWIKRKQLRMVEVAVDVWLTGSSDRSVDAKFEHDLHVGNWRHVKWMPELFLLLREQGLVGGHLGKDVAKTELLDKIVSS